MHKLFNSHLSLDQDQRVHIRMRMYPPNFQLFVNSK